jgi:predicted ATP-binding protein involved in virulence
MELLYIWIDSYKNIKQQGFNFSPKYRFEFTPTTNDKNEVIGGNLTHTENKDFPANFFGDRISNVTAIIGENGSGKSSLLEFMEQIVGKCVIVYIQNSNIEVYYNDLIKIIVDKPLVENLKYDVRLGIQKNLLYYNNMQIERSILEQCIFISFILNKNIDVKNTILSFLPDYISISMNIKKSNDSDEQDSIDNIIDSINEIENDKKRSEYLLKFALLTANYSHTRYQASVITASFSDFDEEEEKGKEELGKQITNLEHIYSEVIMNDNLDEATLCEVIDRSIDKFKNLSIDFYLPEDYHIKGGRIVEILDKIISLLPSTQPNFHLIDNTVFTNIKLIDFNNHIELLKSITELNKLNSYEHFNVFNFDFIDRHFVYQLSSGESLLLNIFGHLTNFFFTKQIENNFLFILIDEGELGLHPQWQKEYLKNLIDVLPQIFEGKTIQIILTSHSPFLVSDLPKENIIFLEKEQGTGLCKVSDLRNHAQTFGQNIHTLFADSFFMEGGLIGEFAKNKIQEALNWLNEVDNKENATKHKKIIDMLGEPIIKQKLLDMYNAKMGINVELERLKQQKILIDKQIHDLENKNNLAQ